MESHNHSSSADAGASGSEAPREMASLATPKQETKEGDDNTKLSCPFDGEDRHGDGIKKNHMPLGNEQCNSPSSSDSVTAAKKLRYLLTGSETGILDLSFHPILVVNKPESSEEEGSEPSQPLEFVSMANWIAVFDCDPNSQQNGVCSYVQELRPINKEQLDTFPETIEEKVLSAPDDVGLIPSWIFVNGQEDLKESDPRDTDAEWTQLHDRNVDKAITHLIPNNMPKRRVVVLFLLLSAYHLSIMAQLFGKLFSIARQGQFAVIVKDRELYEAFATEVGRIRSEAIEELGQRAIVGISPADIDCFMQQMMTATDKADNAIELPSKGQPCHVPGKVRMSWQDLDIITWDDCRCDSIKSDSKEFKEFVEKKKLEFYQGCSSDWWPFYLTEYHKKDLVLRRKCAEELKKKVTGILTASPDGGYTGGGVDTVVTIDIFHDPGSGGSTCARQVLWDFHQKLRCVSVRRVVPDTMAAILAVRRYGYSDDEKEANIPPILVLIDKSSSKTIKYLMSQAKMKTKGLHQLVCIFLCCRRTDASMQCGKDGDENLSICVEHKLTEEERMWFVSKSEQFETKYHQTPEQLIGFVVMKEEGHPQWVEKIVRNVLRDASFHEQTLLKYIAIMEKFIHNFSMPVSCCDDLMDGHNDVKVSESQSKHTSFHPWEYHLTKAAQLFLIGTAIHTKKGRTKALELVNSILAPELVKQLVDERRESIGTVVWQFTSSLVVQQVQQCTSNVSQVHLVNELVRLLTERNNIEHPKLIRRYKFSLLLEYLLENEKMQAYAIVHAFHNYRGGFAPCQTLARMYLSDELYDTAMHYARLGTNSNYDIPGRIIVAQLKGYCLGECETPLNSADVEGLLMLFSQGLEIFKKGKDGNVDTDNVRDGTLTPYYGELELISSFLNILKVCVEPFCSQESHYLLQTYLTTDDDVEGLGDVMRRHRGQLHELQDRVTAIISLISEFLSSSNDSKGIAKILGFHEINYSKLEYYFTLPENDDQVANKQRRKKVESIMMCKPTLRAIFNFFKEDDRKSLKSIIRLLSDNQPKDIFDLKVLVCAHFALAAFPDETVDYGTVEHYVQRLRRLRPPSLYGAFFHLMLLWPRTNQTTMKQSLPQAIKALEDARNLTNQNESHVVLKPRFFLAKRRGLRAFIHRSTLGLADSGNSLDVESVTECLQSEQLRGVLARQKGTLKDNSLKYSIPTGEKITIKLSSPYHVATRRAKVTFILGFSYAGPVAYDVHEL
ncbi:sterile alpha motif domain-containing protein 9-like [Diadema antillarum]|uniref:sterile alpha motif domain-containing protein 9-like n=1 Tax=Diadema antillarum TaxID=105358 RepID=UPI003A8C7551